ncbi:MAG: hypothetical protein HJJLKODD_02199 [Phycisphaerae bacterium]|nr:hypothetical protein [Phycisphaerae bacterium]
MTTPIAVTIRQSPAHQLRINALQKLIFRLMSSGLLIWGATGCAAGGLTLSNYTQLHLPDTDRQAAYAAAEASMHEYFRIDEADPQNGLIRSVPTLSEGDTTDRPLGFSVSSPSAVRQIAEIRLVTENEGVVAACQVLNQQRESNQPHGVRQASTRDDVNNQTPLEESRGFEEDGRTTWVTRNRDTRLEREILAAIQERLSVNIEQ